MAVSWPGHATTKFGAKRDDVEFEPPRDPLLEEGAWESGEHRANEGFHISNDEELLLDRKGSPSSPSPSGRDDALEEPLGKGHSCVQNACQHSRPTGPDKRIGVQVRGPGKVSHSRREARPQQMWRGLDWRGLPRRVPVEEENELLTPRSLERAHVALGDGRPACSNDLPRARTNVSGSRIALPGR